MAIIAGVVLAESSKQSAESAETVAVTMEQISRGAVEETREAERASNQINILAGEIAGVPGNCLQLNKTGFHLVPAAGFCLDHAPVLF